MRAENEVIYIGEKAYSHRQIAVLSAAKATIDGYKIAAETLGIKTTDSPVRGMITGVLDFLHNLGFTDQELNNYATYAGKR